jgi:hypothetical protein
MTTEIDDRWLTGWRERRGWSQDQGAHALGFAPPE